VTRPPDGWVYLVDLPTADNERQAEALADLLADALAIPRDLLAHTPREPSVVRCNPLWIDPLEPDATPAWMAMPPDGDDA
jgi:hypothetical protein